jgi:hypothetical protein
MTNDLKLHWLFRGTIVVLLGLVLRVTLAVLDLTWFDCRPTTRFAQISWLLLSEDRAAYAVAYAVFYTIPTTAFCLTIFTLLERQAPEKAGESYCRRCGYILRGLSAPRCPECGEAI